MQEADFARATESTRAKSEALGYCHEALLLLLHIKRTLPSDESQTQILGQPLGNLIHNTEEERVRLSLRLKELDQNEETGRDDMKETAERANQDSVPSRAHEPVAAVDLRAASDAHSDQEQTRMTELCETTLQR